MFILTEFVANNLSVLTELITNNLSTITEFITNNLNHNSCNQLSLDYNIPTPCILIFVPFSILLLLIVVTMNESKGKGREKQVHKEGQKQEERPGGLVNLMYLKIQECSITTIKAVGTPGQPL